MELIRDSSSLIITYRKFTLDFLVEFDCFDQKLDPSPLEPFVKLHVDDSDLLPDPTMPCRLVGN